MVKRILIRTECACHIWITDLFEPLGRCGRCGNEPVRLRGFAGPDAVTICKHDGPCRN